MTGIRKTGLVHVVSGILLWLVAGPLLAATLEITDGMVLDRLPAGPYMSVYTGVGTPADARAASALPEQDFVPVGKASPLRMMQQQWFRFSIRNASSSPRSLILDFDQALYSRIDWYSRSGNSSKALVTGQSYPHASRDVDYNHFAFRLDIAPGETLTADFSIYTPYAALFVPVFSDSERFTAKIQMLWQFSGAVIGMLYAVALFLLVYIIRMPQLGAAHAMLGQVLFSAMSVLYLSGVIQRWLPDDNSIPWRDIAYALIHGIQGLCYTLAVRSFFQTRNCFPFLDKVLLALVLAGCLVMALLPFAAHEFRQLEYLLVATLAVNFLAMMFSVAVAVIALWRRQQGTALFSVGLILFIMMAFISESGTFGLFPASFVARYSYELGLTLQADFLFLAIATRIFTMEREKLGLQQEMVRLDAEMKARSEFVDRVTHDVKSPLTAVLGAEQLLRDTSNPEDRNNYLDIIRTSCGMVINIIDDILSHSRMKQGQLVLQHGPFSLRKLLSDLESAIRASQQGSPLAFSVTVDPSLPETVVGDRLRLTQVLNNLLTNAFKFTDEGRIDFSVELAGTLSDRVLVRFVIQDTGIGMSDEFISKAFDSYARDEIHSGYRPGFGIGLAICRQLVDIMGGSIDVLSAVGQGSRFTVVIPFGLPD